MPSSAVEATSTIHPVLELGVMPYRNLRVSGYSVPRFHWPVGGKEWYVPSPHSRFGTVHASVGSRAAPSGPSVSALKAPGRRTPACPAHSRLQVP